LKFLEAKVRLSKMPLVLITGIPSSGKSTIALKLKSYLEESKGCKVHLVSENEILQSEGDKNEILSDSRREKSIRGAIKSESIRLLTKDSVVICDGLNYIKGKNIY
jgi:protein KTI12